MKIATLTGALSYDQIIQFLPETLIIHKTAGNFPTSLRVVMAGNIVVCDLDLAGMRALSEIQVMQSPIANVTGDVTFDSLQIPLANGIIKGTTVQITLTFGAVIDGAALYAWQQQEGDMVVQSLRTTVLANSGQDFAKFAYLVIEGMQDTDIVNLAFRTGVIQPSHRQELLVDEIYYGNQSIPDQDVTINNLAQRYETVTLIPSANRTVTFVQYVPVALKSS